MREIRIDTTFTDLRETVVDIADALPEGFTALARDIRDSVAVVDACALRWVNADSATSRDLHELALSKVFRIAAAVHMLDSAAAIRPRTRRRLDDILFRTAELIEPGVTTGGLAQGFV